MGMLRAAARFVCRHSWALVPAFACVYGIQTNGEAEFRTISAAPFVVNLPLQEQYLYGSPLTFLLGSYYQHHGLDYAWAFLVVNSLGLTAFFASLAAVLSREAEEGRGLAAVVLLGLWLPPLVLSLAAPGGWTDPIALMTLAELSLMMAALPGLFGRRLVAWRLLVWSRGAVALQTSRLVLLNARLNGLLPTLGTKPIIEAIGGLMMAFSVLINIRGQYR